MSHEVDVAERESLGTLTIHHPDRDEVFALQTGSLTVTRHTRAGLSERLAVVEYPGEVELTFYVEGWVKIDGRSQLKAGAEVSVFTPEFDRATLPGSRFEVPLAHDAERGRRVSSVYHSGVRDLNRTVIEVTDRRGWGYQVRWSGVMGDGGDEAASRVVIDARLFVSEKR